MGCATDDKRSENLEQWTRPQPSGIRVRNATEAEAYVSRSAII
jgi:hypothetical protein